jgi:hypothetical protein
MNTFQKLNEGVRIAGKRATGNPPSELTLAIWEVEGWMSGDSCCDELTQILAELLIERRKKRDL